MAEARGQFGNPIEREHQPLEPTARRIVKTNQTENTLLCDLTAWRQCELVKAL